MKKTSFLSFIFALFLSVQALAGGMIIKEQPGHDLARFDDLYFTLNSYSALEWLYEGDGTTPRIADDYTDAFTRAYGAWYEDSNGDLQHAASDVAVFEHSAGTYLGYRQEPQRQNKVTAYNVMGGDQDSPTIDAGSLTKGKVYRITAQDGEDFTADGAADNNVGTVFVATGTNVTLDANDTVVEQGGTKLNSDGTDEGTFWSGGGEGARNYRTGGAWINDAIPGMNFSGGTDDESYCEIVTDVTDLASAGLQNLCASGKVYKWASGASALSVLVLDGAAGAIANFIPSAHAKGSGNLQLELNTAGGINQALTGSYVRLAGSETAGVASKMRMELSAGGTCYFLLPQLEKGSAVTSEIITQGSAVTRAADDQQLPLSATVNFRQSQGMLIFKLIPRFNAADISTDIGVISVDDSATSICYYDGTNLYVTDGTNTASVPWAAVSGTEADIYVRWGNGTIQIGVDGSSGSTANYDSAFTITGGNWRLGYGATEALNLYNIRVLRVDRGATYGEGQTASIWNPPWYERLAVADDYYEMLAVNE